MRYDPHREQDPKLWLTGDTETRAREVDEYHRREGIRLPSPKLHAMFHVVAENQVAMGDEYIAREVLERLMAEGLDRHQAIHAIMSVVAGHVHTTLKSSDGKDPAAVYREKLSCLTAEAWLKQEGRERPATQ